VHAVRRSDTLLGGLETYRKPPGLFEQRTSCSRDECGWPMGFLFLQVARDDRNSTNKLIKQSVTVPHVRCYHPLPLSGRWMSDQDDCAMLPLLCINTP
jgi:hypothetical protein